jgi:ATP-dependent DNA ligase
MNRRRLDIAYRYPEMACLTKLPDGTILDGEIVVLDSAGKPTFGGLQSREHVASPIKIQHVSRTKPATYVVFDQLYDRYEPLLKLSLRERRDRLARTLSGCRDSHVVMSDGVECRGIECFKLAVEQGLEGIVAKRLDSPYLPGKRSDCWIKIKRQELVQCAIIGFDQEGRRNFAALLLAAEVDGRLAYVGKVGTGFDTDTRRRINDLLWGRLREQPVIHCRARAIWVEPGLYCEIRCMERTAAGGLRAPVFVRLLLPSGQQ